MTNCRNCFAVRDFAIGSEGHYNWWWLRRCVYSSAWDIMHFDNDLNSRMKMVKCKCHIKTIQWPYLNWSKADSCVDGTRWRCAWVRKWSQHLGVWEQWELRQHKKGSTRMYVQTRRITNKYYSTHSNLLSGTPMLPMHKRLTKIRNRSVWINPFEWIVFKF